MKTVVVVIVCAALGYLAGWGLGAACVAWVSRGYEWRWAELYRGL